MSKLAQSVAQAVRAYAAEAQATLLPLGFDTPAAAEPFIASIRAAVQPLAPREVWCATGSGMLARCLGLALPNATIHAVAVGLRSRWSQQQFPANVIVQPSPLRFEQRTKAVAPFPSCGHYDRKAWALCQASAAPGALFWNVMGDD